MLGLVLGGAAGYLIYEVLDLHAQAVDLRKLDLAVDAKFCKIAQENRDLIAAVASGARVRIVIPPLTGRECP